VTTDTRPNRRPGTRNTGLDTAATTTQRPNCGSGVFCKDEGCKKGHPTETKTVTGFVWVIYPENSLGTLLPFLLVLILLPSSDRYSGVYDRRGVHIGNSRP
jgi:hypothetical protein